MASPRTQTLVTNLGSRRRIPWLPPNGKTVNQNETILVDGVLETIVSMAMDPDVMDQYVSDIESGLVDIKKVGYSVDGETGQVFTATIGDGISEVFDLQCGFLTANALVYVYDLSRQTMIQFFDYQKATPAPTYVRITLQPAPGPNEIQVFVFG